MAVKIRLRRMGAKKSPFYRIVVADSRYPRDGRFIEEIGYYNPMEEPSVVKVDPEKAKKWIANGAQPHRHGEGSLQEARRAVKSSRNWRNQPCRNCWHPSPRALWKTLTRCRLRRMLPLRWNGGLSSARGRGGHGPGHRQAGPHCPGYPRGDARGGYPGKSESGCGDRLSRLFQEGS